MPEPIIKLKNVSVTYEQGKSNEMRALKNINLEIFDGEYIVFFGQSGCGKSTLLYTIVGLEKATEGEVLVCGKNLSTMGKKDLIDFYRTTIGMIFQAFYLVSHLSAKDNLILAKMFFGGSKIEREGKANELMDRFGINSYSDRRPSMMSGGQQQRTAIARALMNDPRIILADEPVGNLDSKNALVVLDLLADIHRKEKKTIIQVTHNAADIHYADRVFYIKDGEIEKVVVNEKKEDLTDGIGRVETRDSNSEFNRLALVHPNLPDTRLKAKMIFRHLLVPYSVSTEEGIELAIEKYIKDEMTKEDLRQYLDNQKDGAGFNSQKAQHLTKDIVEIVENWKKVSVEENEVSLNQKLKEEIFSIRMFLLEEYNGALTKPQVEILNTLIRDLLTKEIDIPKFITMLDLPLKKGGVGLNVRTARHFGEKIALIIDK